MTDTSPGAVARMLDGVTDGPWQVVETHHQWHLPAADQRKEARGVHVERRIFTLQDHPQLKAPYGVVNGANAIGCSHMISISAEDARFIAWSREAVPTLAAERDALTVENQRLRELLSRAPSALSDAFSAGMEEREGGSARRQGKHMEAVEQLRANIRAALAQGDKR